MPGIIVRKQLGIGKQMRRAGGAGGDDRPGCSGKGQDIFPGKLPSLFSFARAPSGQTAAVLFYRYIRSRQAAASQQGLRCFADGGLDMAGKAAYKIAEG